MGIPYLVHSNKYDCTRLCVDYRTLNKITDKNSELLPRLYNILEKLTTVKVFYKINFGSGYHQIRLCPVSVTHMAFDAIYGDLEFFLLQFGLRNTPRTFIELMNSLLVQYLNQLVMTYFDEILIRSDNEHEGVGHI